MEGSNELLQKFSKQLVVNLLNWKKILSLGQPAVASPSKTLGSASNRNTPLHVVTTATTAITKTIYKTDIQVKYTSFTRRHQAFIVGRHKVGKNS